LPIRWLTGRPGIALACATLFAAAVGLSLLATQHGERRSIALEAEILSLQLKELASAIHAEQADLAAHTRELSLSPAIVALVEGRPGSALNRAELESALRAADADSILVINTAGIVRLGVADVAGQFSDRAPEASLLTALLAAATSRTAGTGESSTGAAFVGDDVLSVRPIASRATPAAVVGWLGVRRSLGQRVMGRLSQAVTGSLSGASWPEFTRSALSAGLPDRAAAQDHHGAITGVASADHRAAFAILRDDAGEPVWGYRLERASLVTPAAENAESMRDKIGVGALGCLVLMAAALLGARGALRRQRAADTRYKAIVDQTTDGIVVVDEQSLQILDANPAFLAGLGYDDAEIRDLSLPDVIVDGEATRETLERRLREVGPACALYMQQRSKDGSLCEIEVRCNALDVHGRAALAYITHDVSLRRKAEQQLLDNQQRLDRMAHHDQLTGLPNRHYLAAFLPDAIAVARAAQSMLGVVFLDLDRFKHINDTRGHETGDQMLQEVARRIRACVRDSDVVIRMGGDEFVIVLRNLKSDDEVTQSTKRIIETFTCPIVVDQHPLQTTASVGVSVFPRDGADMAELLKHSDAAMYQAKDRGRNNVQVFSAVMNRKLKRRVAMEASLRDALRLKQLDVHYQPLVHLATRRIVGLEALVRWRHPEQGMIPPDQFIPVAEETGLVVPIGHFVLHRTLQTLRAWRRAGVAVVPISINVAPAQLQRGELHATISTLLKTHDLEPGLLQLEMTEQAVFDHRASHEGGVRPDSMAALRELGVKIAIDDFGTGYSSYLKHWQVDVLKIDRSFVRDLVNDSSDCAIVSAIVAIAKHLRIEVIAEGIEGYQQAEMLRQLGCTIGQGYLFARPMPADECVRLLGVKILESNSDEDMVPPLAMAN
jgi:diguanylate cyclase (GGDEF)-like protein/PAS domain S-box-containing protein